jgi:hypothetical protein
MFVLFSLCVYEIKATYDETWTVVQNLLKPINRERYLEYTTIRMVSKTNEGPAVQGMESMEIPI